MVRRCHRFSGPAQDSGKLLFSVRVGQIEGRTVLITSMREITSLIWVKIKTEDVERKIEILMALILTSSALGDSGLRLGMNHILRWLGFDFAKMTITAIDGLRLPTPLVVDYPSLQKPMTTRINEDYPDNTTDGMPPKE